MDEIAALVQRLAATAPLNDGVRRSAYACPTPAVREPGRRGPHSLSSAQKIVARKSHPAERHKSAPLRRLVTRLRGSSRVRVYASRRSTYASRARRSVPAAQYCERASGRRYCTTPSRVRVLVCGRDVVAHRSVGTVLVLRPIGRLARGRSRAASLVLAMPHLRPFAPAPFLVAVPPLRAQARLT